MRLMTRKGISVFLKNIYSNDTFPTRMSSSNLDHFNDPSSPHPLPEPPDVEICFDVEPDTTVKNDFDELNEDECFDPGGTDIANITRKRPKPGKNEHETDRVHKSWEFLAKVNNGQTLGQPTK
ncbi:hypothetical protein Tco_0678306 [Tanacetum coccineum]|uniref:Uncharacterized protein n=1 Tax=Tanacetum coccineum TaxID=301880 RepID=A0ABQ4XF89_9ASTR